MPKFFSVFILATLVAISGIGVAYLILPDGVISAQHVDHMFAEGDTMVMNHLDNHDHMLIDGFAVRWTGSCTGWTRELNFETLIGDLLHWHAYCTIAIFIALYHPTKGYSITSQVAIFGTSLFVLGCGMTHLIDAYTLFDPQYQFRAWFMIANGIISEYSVAFVLWALLRTQALKENKQTLKP